MYHDYFGLKEQAFSIAVNPRYLYMSEHHREAFAHLFYGVRNGGFVLLTGEVGTGKTTIIRCLLEQMPEDTDIAIILNPMASVPELLSTICDELGVAYSPNDLSVKNLTDALHQHLLNNHTQGRNTVLLIDEAQLLDVSALEQIRLLTNLETTTKKLLQIILVGQPELNEMLAQPRLRQLSQRITARYHLQPLSVEGTYAYIKHRLKIAGMTADSAPFTPRIVKRIHRFTEGIPRRINILCERTLIGAYGHNKREIDQKILQLACREVMGEQTPTPWIKKWLLPSSATTIFLAVLGALLYLGLDHNTDKTAVQPEPIMQNQVADLSPTKQPNLELDSEAPSSSDNANSDSLLQSNTSIEPKDNALTVESTETLVTDNTNSSETVFWLKDKNSALNNLATYLSITNGNTENPCESAKTESYVCENITVLTWDDLIQLNRPVILTMVTPAKQKAYVTLLGLQNDSALIQIYGTRHIVDLETLGPLWTGSADYFLHKPYGYDEPISFGDRNPTVAWIAQQFANWDEQPRPLATKRYNKALEERVKIFQRSHGLEPDGVFGLQTLHRFNEILALDKALITDFDEST